MKKMLEVVKANKGVIIRNGLIMVGTFVGLAIVDGILSKKDEIDYNYDGDETEDNFESGPDEE